jgi:hypothetical protein
VVSAHIESITVKAPETDGAAETVDEVEDDDGTVGEEEDSRSGRHRRRNSGGGIRVKVGQTVVVQLRVHNYLPVAFVPDRVSLTMKQASPSGLHLTGETPMEQIYDDDDGSENGALPGQEEIEFRLTGVQHSPAEAEGTNDVSGNEHGQIHLVPFTTSPAVVTAGGDEGLGSSTQVTFEAVMLSEGSFFFEQVAFSIGNLILRSPIEAKAAGTAPNWWSSPGRDQGMGAKTDFALLKKDVEVLPWTPTFHFGVKPPLFIISEGLFNESENCMSAFVTLHSGQDRFEASMLGIQCMGSTCNNGTSFHSGGFHCMFDGQAQVGCIRGCADHLSDATAQGTTPAHNAIIAKACAAMVAPRGGDVSEAGFGGVEGATFELLDVRMDFEEGDGGGKIILHLPAVGPQCLLCVAVRLKANYIQRDPNAQPLPSPDGRTPDQVHTLLTQPWISGPLSQRDPMMNGPTAAALFAAAPILPSSLEMSLLKVSLRGHRKFTPGCHNCADVSTQVAIDRTVAIPSCKPWDVQFVGNTVGGDKIFLQVITRCTAVVPLVIRKVQIHPLEKDGHSSLKIIQDPNTIKGEPHTLQPQHQAYFGYMLEYTKGEQSGADGSSDSDDCWGRLELEYSCHAGNSSSVKQVHTFRAMVRWDVFSPTPRVPRPALPAPAAGGGPQFAPSESHFDIQFTVHKLASDDVNFGFVGSLMTFNLEIGLPSLGVGTTGLSTNTPKYMVHIHSKDSDWLMAGYNKIELEMSSGESKDIQLKMMPVQCGHVSLPSVSIYRRIDKIRVHYFQNLERVHIVPRGSAAVLMRRFQVEPSSHDFFSCPTRHAYPKCAFAFCKRMVKGAPSHCLQSFTFSILTQVEPAATTLVNVGL